MAKEQLNTSDFINQIFSFRDQMLSSMRDVVDAADDMKKVIGTDLFDISSAEEYADNIKDLFREMTTFSRQIEGKLASDRVKDFKLFIKLQKTLFDEILEDIANSKALDEVTKTFKQPFEEMFDSFTDSAKSVPFVGDILYDRMGVEDIRKKLTSDLSSAFSQNLGGKIDISSVMAAFTSTITAIASAISNVLKTILLNPWLLAIVGAVLLFKKLVDLEESAEKFRTDMGISNQQSKELRAEIERSALGARRFGVEMDDVYSSASELVKVFGNTKLISGELASNLATVSKMTGATDEDVASVYQQFSAFNDQTAASSQNMLKTLSYSSQLAGIPMTSMFDDIASNSEFIATYMGESAESVGASAINARLLGLNLKQVSDIMSNIMDFETSIENELQASILIGRQLNFNRARYLAFQGDIEGATNEIMRQVGSLDEFNRMNPIAKKAFADAVGLTVDELRNSLQTQRMLNNLGSEDRKRLEESLEIIKGKKEVGDEELRNNIMTQSSLTQMKNLWMQIGASLTRIILPVIEVISSVIGWIAEKLNWVFDLFEGIKGESKETSSWWQNLASWALKFSVSLLAIWGIMKGIKVLMSVGGLAGKAGGGLFSGLGKGIGDFVGSLGKMNTATLLKGALALALIGASLIPLAYGLSLLKGISWDTLAMAGVAILGLTIALAAIGALMTSGVGAVAILAGAAALVIMAGSLVVFGIALQEIQKGSGGMDVLAEGLYKLGSIAPMLILAATGITAVGIALAAFGAGSVAAGIGSLVGDFLGGDPIEKLATLAMLGPGLMMTATALNQIQSVLGEGINFSALDNAPTSINLPVEASTSIKDTIQTGNNIIVNKLNEVVDAINNIDINLDSRKVNTNLGRTAPISKLG